MKKETNEQNKKKPKKPNPQKTRKTNPKEVSYSITKYKYDSLAGRRSPGSAAAGGGLLRLSWGRGEPAGQRPPPDAETPPAARPSFTSFQNLSALELPSENCQTSGAPWALRQVGGYAEPTESMGTEERTGVTWPTV